MIILTILILPVHEHIYLSICLCHLQFLHCLIVFRVKVIFLYILYFIYSYIFYFDAIVNGIVFIISLFDSLLLVYRNATDFGILILYPDTSFILFFGGVLRIFYI